MRLTLATMVAVVLALPTITTALTAQIVVRSIPAIPARGMLIRLVATEAGLDLPVSIAGIAAGEPLHFVRQDSATWTALAGIPIEGGDSFSISLKVARRPAPIGLQVTHRSAQLPDTLTATIRVTASPAGSERLRVAPSKLNLTRALQQRVAREIERAHAVGRESHDTPLLWHQPFSRPRGSRITSEFGTARVYNGQVTSRHLGTDFAGAVGDSVFAANRGVVARVGHFYLAGNVVYLDHGAGLTTAYFHLSRIFVAPGDTVERGQLIGAVGKTGRVTGPHLHWSVRYGIVPVDPMSLLEVGE
jgi:murein DD-endopeptidase MepM/ murein hydrolase activator NlpD